MVLLLSVLSARAAPEVDVSLGLWPLDAPVHDLQDPLLERAASPEPTLRLQLVATPPRRTVWAGGLQLDWIRRTWTYRDVLWHGYDAVRADVQLGARTFLGPRDRERTRVWLDWGGGVAVTARMWRNPATSGWASALGPSAQLGLGLAHGEGPLQGFVEVFGRLGAISTGGVVDCIGGVPCPQTSSSPAGPGLAVLAGAAFR